MAHRSDTHDALRTVTNMSRYVSTAALALATGLTPGFLTFCLGRDAAPEAPVRVDQAGCVSGGGREEMMWSTALTGLACCAR